MWRLRFWEDHRRWCSPHDKLYFAENYKFKSDIIISKDEHLPSYPQGTKFCFQLHTCKSMPLAEWQHLIYYVVSFYNAWPGWKDCKLKILTAKFPQLKIPWVCNPAEEIIYYSLKNLLISCPKCQEGEKKERERQRDHMVKMHPYYKVFFLMDYHYWANINPVLGLLREKNTNVIYLFNCQLHF